jgi:hypothetical protein
MIFASSTKNVDAISKIRVNISIKNKSLKRDYVLCHN